MKRLPLLLDAAPKARRAARVSDESIPRAQIGCPVVGIFGAPESPFALGFASMLIETLAKSVSVDAWLEAAPWHSASPARLSAAGAREVRMFDATLQALEHETSNAAVVVAVGESILARLETVLRVWIAPNLRALQVGAATERADLSLAFDYAGVAARIGAGLATRLARAPALVADRSA